PGRALEAGQRVSHAIFGVGVTSSSSRGHTVVCFDEGGTRTFVTSILKVDVLSAPHAWETTPRGKNRPCGVVAQPRAERIQSPRAPCCSPGRRLPRWLMDEDPGNSSRISKIWLYAIDTRELIQVAAHNPKFFDGSTPNNPSFITQDEESSGIIDAAEVLGEGWFLLDVQ